MSVDQPDPQLIEALRKQVAALRDRVDEQDERIAELEEQIDNGGSSSGVGGRDQAVMDQLEVGDVVTSARLMELYRNHTDVRNKKTLKKRVKSIKKRPEFEAIGYGKWRYGGGDSDV
ncbi:hypothetical protein [Halalkalicoccus sp. NIPERK01]|uniref:hypothetical protein n=1 Tax=Halalkalicoccus sp. NIPERK01 TaxID=3053469 RepID=UPI00256ECA9D|nr:hypothetical protein [Halalkalicoccus sp. NIPERK01]MDL5361370.1 hypothetical protein [Halalkalicoccus sp. NIPERK01]